MDFKLKNYKLLKNKQYIKTTKLFFVYNGNNLNFENWILIEQILNKLNLTFYKIYNTLIIKNLLNSIYTNLKHLIHSNIIFINTNIKTKIKLKNLINLNVILTLLCIKLNNKIYSTAQIKNVNLLDYNAKVLRLTKLLKTCLKVPFKFMKN